MRRHLYVTSIKEASKLENPKRSEKGARAPLLHAPRTALAIFDRQCLSLPHFLHLCKARLEMSKTPVSKSTDMWAGPGRGVTARARLAGVASAAATAARAARTGSGGAYAEPPVDTSLAGILKAARESNALRRGVAATGTGSAGAGAASVAASRYAAAPFGASAGAGSAAGSARAPAPAGMPPASSWQTYAAAAAAGAPAAGAHAAARAQALPVPRALGSGPARRGNPSP